MDTTAINPLGRNPFDAFVVESQKIHKVLQPYIEKNNQMFARLRSFINNPRTKAELHIYRKAIKGATPSIAKVILSLISRFFYLVFLQILSSRNLDKGKKRISTLLHILGVIPCAPNSSPKEATI